MASVTSTMLPLGTEAPAFDLPDIRGNRVAISDFQGSAALLVVFMCNHCPYVKHIRESFVELAREYQAKGVAVVAISSNDVEAYPDDSPEQMARDAETFGYTFPYLYDQTQDVARAYRAACTPDFFLFDAERRLVYRGQMDSSRPGGDKAPTGEDLRAALVAVLAGGQVSPQQKPSMGCSIKWKPGKEPDYFKAG